FITTIGGNGQRGYSGDGGGAAFAMLNGPSAVAVDGAGNVYVADTGNHAVRTLQFSGFGLTVSAVANGASNLSGPIAPGEVVVLYGSGLGPVALVQASLNASGNVGTNLAGTSVFFNNAAAPVLYTSANQVGAIVPYGITGSRVQVFVQYQGQVSAPASVDVARAAPALFTLSGGGSGQVLAMNSDRSINDAAHPARAGSFVTLYATGEGQTNPPGQNGVPGSSPL